MAGHGEYPVNWVSSSTEDILRGGMDARSNPNANDRTEGKPLRESECFRASSGRRYWREYLPHRRAGQPPKPPLLIPCVRICELRQRVPRSGEDEQVVPDGV